MKFHNFTFAVLSLLAVASLTACGGDSDSPTSENVSPTPSMDTSVATSASSNADAMGGINISSDNTKEIFDLVADIGDSWQIKLDKIAKTFDLTVIKSQYGLKAISGTFTSDSTSGSRTSYKLSTISAPSIGALITDSSTQSVTGTMTVGDVSASVSGTAKQATELKKLAGTYNFMMATRNLTPSNGNFNRDMAAGQILISPDGTTATMCHGGVFQNGVCTSLDTSVPETASLKLALDSGRISVKVGDLDFGTATVLASNLGKALQLDQFGLNQEGVMRTGVAYLAEAKTLDARALNGQWLCTAQGKPWNTLTASGETGSSKNLATGTVMDATFKFNKINTHEGKLLDVAGFISGGARTDGVSDYTLILPVSSTLVVNETDGSLLRVCGKTSN